MKLIHPTKFKMHIETLEQGREYNFGYGRPAIWELTKGERSQWVKIEELNVIFNHPRTHPDLPHIIEKLVDETHTPD